MNAPARDFQLRLARSGDVSSLVNIASLANARLDNEARFSSAGENGGARTETILVLTRKEIVQGYLSYTRVLDEVTILDVAIHPDEQGQGLGRILLSGSIQQMLSLGVERCLLEVRESNLAARALYAKLDFQLDGQRKNYCPAENGRENALLMSRQL